MKDLASGESPFRMDFENYTIGRLIQDRGNYDFDHPDYQDARAKILWRVHDLGWSGSKFKDIESRVGSGRYHSRGESQSRAIWEKVLLDRLLRTSK